MERSILHILSILTLSLTLFSCSKAMDIVPSNDKSYSFPYSSENGQASLAIGTVKERESIRYIQLDPVSTAFVVNLAEIKEFPVGSRVFLEYRQVLSSETPAFCTEAILVEWASPLDVGEIRYVMDALPGDPVSIVLDWITCFEDGFLTLHYSVPSKGKAQHTFALYPGATPLEYRLVHEANGDTEGDLTDGIVCFPIGDILFDSGAESNTVSLTYLNIDNIWKTLTFDYRSPK